ncbi:hypothetical protein M8C21_008813, partial [Ambrosia artemisiifolia]
MNHILVGFGIVAATCVLPQLIVQADTLGWFTRKKKKENRTQGLENAKTTNLVWLEQRSDQSFTFYVTSADKVVLECRTLGIMLFITINTPEQ